LHLSATGPGEVTAADIEAPSNVEVINSDLYLGTLADKKSKLVAEITIETGYGYSLGEERKSTAVGVIPIDSVFTPIVRVNYRPESTRVGRQTNLDRLVLEIWTDGTISPLDAMKQATTRALAPMTWGLEISNVINKAEMKGVTSEAQSEAFLEMLEGIDINADAATFSRALSDTLQIARRYRLSAYDASYLELALREALPLATLDEDLQKAASKAGRDKAIRGQVDIDTLAHATRCKVWYHCIIVLREYRRQPCPCQSDSIRRSRRESFRRPGAWASPNRSL